MLCYGRSRSGFMSAWDRLLNLNVCMFVCLHLEDCSLLLVGRCWMCFSLWDLGLGVVFDGGCYLGL